MFQARQSGQYRTYQTVRPVLCIAVWNSSVVPYFRGTRSRGEVGRSSFGRWGCWLLAVGSWSVGRPFAQLPGSRRSCLSMTGSLGGAAHARLAHNRAGRHAVSPRRFGPWEGQARGDISGTLVAAEVRGARLGFVRGGRYSRCCLVLQVLHIGLWYVICVLYSSSGGYIYTACVCVGGLL